MNKDFAGMLRSRQTTPLNTSKIIRIKDGELTLPPNIILLFKLCLSEKKTKVEKFELKKSIEIAINLRNCLQK